MSTDPIDKKQWQLQAGVYLDDQTIGGGASLVRRFHLKERLKLDIDLTAFGTTGYGAPKSMELTPEDKARGLVSKTTQYGKGFVGELGIALPLYLTRSIYIAPRVSIGGSVNQLMNGINQGQGDLIPACRYVPSGGCVPVPVAGGAGVPTMTANEMIEGGLRFTAGAKAGWDINSFFSIVAGGGVFVEPGRRTNWYGTGSLVLRLIEPDAPSTPPPPDEEPSTSPEPQQSTPPPAATPETQQPQPPVQTAPAQKTPTATPQTPAKPLQQPGTPAPSAPVPVPGTPSTAPTAGTVKVMTKPDGAKIEVNGKDTGKMTPAVLDEYKAGQRLIIKLRKDGYQEVKRTIFVDKDKQVAINAVLKKAGDPTPAGPEQPVPEQPAPPAQPLPVPVPTPVPVPVPTPVTAPTPTPPAPVRPSWISAEEEKWLAADGLRPVALNRNDTVSIKLRKPGMSVDTILRNIIPYNIWRKSSVVKVSFNGKLGNRNLFLTGTEVAKDFQTTVTEYKIKIVRPNYIKISWRQVDVNTAKQFFQNNKDVLANVLKQAGINENVDDYIKKPLENNLEDTANVWGHHEYYSDSGYYRFEQHVELTGFIARNAVKAAGRTAQTEAGLKIGYLTIGETGRAGGRGSKGTPVQSMSGETLRAGE